MDMKAKARSLLKDILGPSAERPHFEDKIEQALTEAYESGVKAGKIEAYEDAAKMAPGISASSSLRRELNKKALALLSDGP